MIKFTDVDIQKEFNECHFRQECDGADICRGECAPCTHVIEGGQCAMLKDYFSKRKEANNETNRC